MGGSLEPIRVLVMAGGVRLLAQARLIAQAFCRDGIDKARPGDALARRPLVSNPAETATRHLQSGHLYEQAPPRVDDGRPRVEAHGRPVFAQAEVMVNSYRYILDELPRVHGLLGATNRMRSDVGSAPDDERYDVVIHFGVSPNSNGAVALEHCARRYGYNHGVADNEGQKMPIRNADAETIDRGFVGDEWNVTHPSPLDGAEQVATDIDIETAARRLDQHGGFRCETSTDPGNLVCGAMFFASLASAQRTKRMGRPPMQVAFVHIPECVERADRLI